ncbi:Aluminum-activated malate transporter 9 [Zea mays]|uniref:Aluminum-activated malate transporter 9 n=1 Tax=Zea mays TaxID=4577 RepID=A0A3L6D8N1_MAIZE|nr:Aluminum-activated malate transporter 9 [Zea mays]
MAVASAARTATPASPARLGSLWSTLEDQRGAAVPLLSSAWTLPTTSQGGIAGDGEQLPKEGLLRRAGGVVARWWGAACGAVAELWAFARADPRKPVFAGKVALALALISLLVFLREPRDIVSHSVWAILTVVVVFEFSIGAFALVVAELSKHLGKLEEVILITSILIVAFFTTLTKLHPKMKPYEYGFRVFLLTFCYVMVSGYNTGKFTDTATSRFILIAIGAAVSLGINVGIYPIWAGEDLHNLIAKNFTGVAKSLEGCVDGYLRCMEYERIPSKILVYQASDDPVYSGYRAAVEASAQEETLLGFAIWEPPHGPYKTMNYPWRSFTKVSGALRHCSFAVMALHGCILSEIQAPPESRRVFSAEIQRVGQEGAKVLRELGSRVKTMTKLSSSGILFEVHMAAEELQKKIDEKSYLLVNTERWDASKQAQGIKEVVNGTRAVETENKNKENKNDGTSAVEKENKAKENNNGGLEPTIVDQTLVHQSKSFLANSFLSRYDSASAIDGFKPALSWPARKSFHPNIPLEDEDSQTYESASALSLATFASLLIEFVARLQNVVNAFEELSEKANFKDPVVEPTAVSTSNVRFFDKLCKFVGF